MLRAGTKFCRSARGLSHSQQAKCASSYTYHLVEPMPGLPECGQDIPPTQRGLVQFDNGIYLGATTTTSPLATVNMVVRAGSRYELPGEEGMSHFLRRLAYKSTDKHSAVWMACLPQWFGMKLSCTGTRDAITYSGTCLKDDVDHLLDLMVQTITAPKFYNWEILYNPIEHEMHSPRLFDAQKRVAADNTAVAQNRAAVMMEELQNKAFRGGLSNPVYCPSYRVGQISDEDVAKYHARRYTGCNIGVFGAGLHYEDLQTGVTRHGLYNIAKGDATALQAEGASRFTASSADVRLPSSGPTVLAALVGQGASLTGDNHISSLLLQRILGMAPQMEVGLDCSRLQTAASKASSAFSQVQALNVNLSDNGLFGVQVEAEPSNIRSVLKAVTGEFVRASSGLTEKDLKAAKAQLRLDLLATQESHTSILDDMAYQSMYRGGKYLLPEKVIERVNSTTVKDVKAFAQSVLQSKHVLAAHGDLHDTPFLDELGL